MIFFPSEWALHFGEHLVTAYPPRGGRYRFHERLRPAPDFASIVEQILAGDPAFKVTYVGETLKLVTEEGEYGAWVRIQGTREGGPAQRLIGAILTEEFAAALDTLTVIPEMFAEFARRSLDFLRGATFGLGRRRRLFLYTPPPGWQALPSGLVANWYPLDFPRNRTNIVVHPAMPTTLLPAAAIDERFAGAGAGLTVEESAREPFNSVTGLEGGYLRMAGRSAGKGERTYRDTVVFVGEQYVYLMRMETMAADQLLTLRELFRAVAASMRPLPGYNDRRLGLAFAPAPTIMEHWVH